MSKKKKHHPSDEAKTATAPESDGVLEKIDKIDTAVSKKLSSIWVVLGLIIGGLAVAVGVGFVLAEGATGTVDICRNENSESMSAIMLTTSDSYSRNHTITNRALFPVDIRTGKKGKSYDPGEASQCLGGLGEDALLYTTKDGIHTRNVETGALAKTENDLLGDLSKSKSTWKYDAHSHRLYVRTQFNDEFYRDLATHEQWPVASAPEAKVTLKPNDLQPLEHAITFDARHGLTGSSLALKCEGSRCKLATLAMNAYGNTIGVDPSVKPLPNADEILVATITKYLPNDDGILVSALDRLDESSRQLVLLGLDGRVKWKTPIKQKSIDGYVAGDMLVLGDMDPLDPSIAKKDRYYGNHDVDVWLVGKSDGKIAGTVHIPKRTTVQRDLADVVARFGDIIVVAAHGDAVALSVRGGAPLWQKHY